MWYLAIGLATRGWESHNFSFNNTVDNFPVCAHAVLDSPEILCGLHLYAQGVDKWTLVWTSDFSEPLVHNTSA